MSKIIIEEDYRGFQISFDKNEGIFIALSDSWIDKKSTSTTIKGAKKIVDDFIKDNENFNPFFIFDKSKVIGSSFSNPKYTTLKVVGKRKDDRFQCIDEKGKDEQLSLQYSGINTWFIVEKDTEEIVQSIMDEVSIIDRKIDALEELKKEKVKELDSKYKFKPFTDWVKKTFPEVKIGR